MVRHARTSEASVRRGTARVNAFHRNTELKTAADRSAVTPNSVTIDAPAGWICARDPWYCTSRP
jgi:hypothetical protein